MQNLISCLHLQASGQPLTLDQNELEKQSRAV